MAIIDVVKYESRTSELVGKFPSDNIRLGSQLVVYPSQTAFFVKGGRVYDEFICGTYTIKSENIPLLDKVINLPFGGNSPFKADVWFVNQIELLDCKWGTASPIQIKDPAYNILIPITSYGQYGIKITEPRKFMKRLIGNMPTFSTTKLLEYFRGVVMSHITQIVCDKLTEAQICVVNLNGHVREISEYLKEKLGEVFRGYGVDLLNFNVVTFNIKEDNPNFQTIQNAEAQKTKMKIYGDQYQQIQSWDAINTAAANPNGMAGAGVGLGAGMAIGSQMASAMGQQMNVTQHTQATPLPTGLYRVTLDGLSDTEMTFAQIVNKIFRGELTEDTLVWSTQFGRWQPINTQTEFAPYFQQ